MLPTIDWKAEFEKANDYDSWLARAESEENRANMDSARRGYQIDAAASALLTSLPKAVHVVAIAEDWCGDVVRHVPVLQAMCDKAPNLHVRFIHRDDNLDIFARFLTNGGEGIPKFIFLSDQFVECGNWGPIPSEARELLSRGKACGDIKSAREIITQDYKADPERLTTLNELIHLVGIAATEKV
jgi:thiol-disulfide isomerase/thioredoxin